MPGTKAGAIKAAKTNLERHGKDFYRNIGRIGGRNGTTGGFNANNDMAVLAGTLGGRHMKGQPDKYKRITFQAQCKRPPSVTTKVGFPTRKVRINVDKYVGAYDEDKANTVTVKVNSVAEVAVMELEAKGYIAITNCEILGGE